MTSKHSVSPTLHKYTSIKAVSLVGTVRARRNRAVEAEPRVGILRLGRENMGHQLRRWPGDERKGA